MLAGRLYKQGSDQILRLCIEVHEQDLYLSQSHVQTTGIHNGHAQTYQRLMRMGVYWPKMQQSVHNYIQSCLIYTFQKPIEHATLFKVTVAPKWSSYIVDYLTSGILPETMTPSRVRAITKEAEDYVLIKDNLYKRGKDGQLQMCATEEEYVPILQQAHSGQAGGHFLAEKMAKSILYAGIWWPTLFMDAEEFIKRCDDYQRTKIPRGRDDMSLRPMMGARAFAKWGIGFVGPCPPAYKSHAQYIIVATDYLTKWVEAKAITKNDAKTIAQFLYENKFTRYGLPIEIVSDRGTHFVNEVIEQLLDEFMVIHRKSAPYQPQANGQAESTNKILVTVLTKIVSESRADWDQKLHSVLWAYQVAYKTSIGTTPFNMVYGIQAILPLEFLIPTLRVAKELEWTGHELSEQIEVLEKLDETKLRAVASIYAQKRNMKSFFDQHVINKEFATRDYVLMYTLKQHSKKLQKQGNGTYVIHDISLSGAIKLATLEGEEMLNWISGCRLKKYHLPLSTEMLAKIHSAKERKNKLNEIKAKAREEARIRILKRKQKLQQQKQPPIEETTPVPLAAIQNCEQWQIGIDVRINVILSNGQYQRALVDTGARVNVVNYTTYKKLTDQPLMQCSRNIAAANKEIMPTMGFINLNINFVEIYVRINS
ncbi:hypothetical protein L7F22_024223 [Adiantum nelumboides]|nr:hypothetical protein [Adiantum nelumboides]